MSTGLYQDSFSVDIFLASVSAATLAQVWIAPADVDVLGLLLHLGTACGATDGLHVNVSNLSTAQQGGSGTPVSAYNLWTATNVPTILGTATNNIPAVVQTAVVDNVPYALNYPLPGQSPVTGYETAQSSAQGTFTAVTAPPTIYNYGGGALVAPDNTYTDYNGVLLTPASLVHSGDVLSFVITAAGSGNSVGSAANLTLNLFVSKR